MKFTEFNFKDYIQEALKDLNFVEATEVQEKLIPVVLSGRDLVGESKTGSGKTHTFLLPIFQELDEEADSVQAVITAPSRELATQIYQAARQLASFSEQEIRVANYVGGTDKARQIGKLESSQPHIVIGTPGRIYDLVESGDLAIHKAHTFVVDEADMTLDMGFLETVDRIAARLPKDLQFLVFSATIPQKLQPFLQKYLSNPVMEQIKTKTVIADTIDNWLLSTKGRDKNAQIYEISQILQPYLAMIFVNTKTRVSHVINDAIPQDLSFFVHRVGRTGRNGLAGTAITLYQPSDDSDIRELEKLGIKFTPKMIKNGEFQDTYDRDRRANREKTKEKLDTEMIGLVKKKKKKIKPGYKKKIQWAVNEKRRKTKRAENRARGRAERKAKRQTF